MAFSVTPACSKRWPTSRWPRKGEYASSSVGDCIAREMTGLERDRARDRVDDASHVLERLLRRRIDVDDAKRGVRHDGRCGTARVVDGYRDRLVEVVVLRAVRV